MADVILKRF